MKFEWDPRKAAANVRKHGISFVDAIAVFSDPLAKIHDDPDHSEAEAREIIVGHASLGTLLLVSFHERGEAVRIISARRATNRERHEYEEAPG